MMLLDVVVESHPGLHTSATSQPMNQDFKDERLDIATYVVLHLIVRSAVLAPHYIINAFPSAPLMKLSQQ